MKRQYATSILLQKEFKEDHNTRQNLQLFLDHGMLENDGVLNHEELKEVAINEFIEKNNEGKKLIKEGYSIFLTTCCILPLIDED